MKEMQEESGLDDEEALFKYIEREINERSYGASAAEEEEDEEEEEIEEVVVEEAPVLAKKGKKGAKKAPSGPDLDSEVGNLDMSIFDTAEENMSRELGEDVAGAAAAAAKKASTKLMQQKKGKKGKK